MKSFYLLLLSLLLISVSCEDPSDVGSGLIPIDDALPVDSLSYNNLVLNNHRDDSILNSSIGQHQLGIFQDDVFGKSTASIFTELYFSGSFPRLENAVFDSLVLYLSVTDFQGDSLIPQTINVYEMADTLKTSSGDNGELYYIFEDVAKGDLLTSFDQVVYSSEDSFVDTTSTTPHFKTLMPHSFGESLFTQINESMITNAYELQQYIKGFVFEPDSSVGGDGWFQISLNQSLPKLTGLYFYYHNDEASARFPIQILNIADADIGTDTFDSGAQNINKIVNTYQEAEAQLSLQLDNFSPNGNDFGYIQGGNGTYIEIGFEDALDQLPSNIQINYAELNLKPIIENEADSLLLPNRLILAEGFFVNNNNEQIGPTLGIDGSGTPNTVDQSRFDASTSAIYNSTDGIYTFFLPRTMQSMIEGVIQPKLYMLVNNRTQSTNGIKFEKEDLELKLFYTKLD